MGHKAVGPVCCGWVSEFITSTCSIAYLSVKMYILSALSTLLVYTRRCATSILVLYDIDIIIQQIMNVFHLRNSENILILLKDGMFIINICILFNEIRCSQSIWSSFTPCMYVCSVPTAIDKPHPPVSVCPGGHTAAGFLNERFSQR